MDRLFVPHEMSSGGALSPLHQIEPYIVEILISYSKLRLSPNPHECIALINSLIENTDHQKKLISWKKKHSYFGCEEDLGKIGLGYFNLFMKRHADKLTSKRGHKYELDRSNWTTYQNFKQMYNNICDALLDCKIAVLFDQSVWMNKEGQSVSRDDNDRIGMKVTIDIIRPDLCLLADEVGCNTCQKGDGHVGGKRLVCQKGCVPYKVTGKKDKHFTVMGFTNLAGEPILCVILITGKEDNFLVRTGIVDDDEVEVIGTPDDPDFVLKNTGEGKKFPGGPSCMYKGKEIPAFVEFSESGGMTGKMFVNVLKHLDELGIYDNDRKQGYTPMLLVDGHDSRLDLDFLRYINENEHKWCICVGVPYGTSYWQVGDSPEQNGSFKICLTELKDLLMKKQMRYHISDMQIQLTDIIPLVIKAWKKSFARIEKKTRLPLLSEGGGLSLENYYFILTFVLP